MRNLYIFLFFSTLCFSCDNWIGEQSLPKGRGDRGEIVLVLDSVRWAGDVGRELRLTYRELVDGLPRNEPMFDIRHIIPFHFKGILKHARNLILVVPLNDNSNESQRMQNFFTKNSLDSMRSNDKIFIIKRKNLFATNQEVLFLIGQNDTRLTENIIHNREYLRSFFNNVEDNREVQDLFKIKEEKLISGKLESDYSFNLRVPYGYKIAESKDDFVWLRQAGLEVDKNIFIAFKNYSSENDFNDDQIIAWRNEICKKYIYENKDNDQSYIITEPEVQPTIQEINFNNKYAKHMKGLWKTRNISMGGPFISYVLVDEELNRMYYLEAFLYSPGVDQREIVRELNVVLKTFKTKSELAG